MLKNRSKLRRMKSKLDFNLNFYQLTVMLTPNQIPDPKQAKQPEELTSKALEFLQQKIKSTTNELDLIFKSTRLIIDPPAKDQISKLSDETLEQIKTQFDQIYFSVEGFHQSFFLENIVRVRLTS